VVTINDATNTPVPFLYANLSAAQLATFANSSIVQQKMIAYLRGGTTYGPAPTPTVIEGTGIGQFRKRFGPLGDITNGQPVIVGAPINPPIFSDYNDPGYSTYVSSNAARAKRIFVPSNDGMVHVLNDTDGTEVYAFIPKALIRSTVDSGGKPTGLQGLTYQDGGVPIYKHHFYVDSSPRAADVDFGNGTGDWHTIVVGGLGKGGNSYYALDATNATATNEAQAAAKVLWEFHDPDMVYTYGRPIIVKTRALGWVVIVTAGYNNVSGLGKIFFLNPKTGAKLYEMSTTAGSPGSPSGLAQINGFTKDFHNQIAEQIYGGDLMGNLWRFDVSDPNKANWKVDLFAKLTDPSGIVQPVTSAPQIEIDFSNGIDRYVFVGTGQLLDTSDLTTPTPAQQQTLYAIRDGTLAAPLSTGLPISPRSTMKPVNADLVSAIAGGAPNGWYQDLPGGQRIVVDLEADVNIVAYIGTSPQTDPCIIALPATIYAREYQTGASLIETDTGGGTYAIAPSAALASGAVGFQVVGMTGSDGSVTLGGLMSAEIPGTSPIIFKNPLINTSHRFSWRLLGGD
jgi:type IV pilus assembly protein PilY1